MCGKRNNSTIRIGQIAIFVLLMIIWQSFQISSTRVLIGGGNELSRQIEVIRQVSQGMIKKGDTVFLSTHSERIDEEIASLGAAIKRFDSKDSVGFDNGLIQVLDRFCSREQNKEPEAFYFIWTDESEETIMELSNEVRSLNFYFFFQAILPYEGESAFVIDKILRLQPKENLLHRYCEANKIIGSKQVLLIIDGNDFSPWIGSVKTGQFTWLANDPVRQMENSDYVVIDMPPLSTYDVYWMGQLHSKPYWSFENQDAEAYEQAVERIKTQNGIVFVDQQLNLGMTASRFFKECDSKQEVLDGHYFHQLCLK